MNILKKIKRILKREKKHDHMKGSWRYKEDGISKVSTNEDEF